MNTPQTPSNWQLPCKYLRNKEMYYHDDPEGEFGSAAYWCAKTQEAFGPDGQPAEKNDCCSHRSCHIK